MATPIIKTHESYEAMCISGYFANLLCFTAATRSGPENMENKLSPLAEEVSSLELAESPWVPDQLFVTSLEDKKLY